MKISANLGFLYTDLPLVDRIAAAARDGFDAVEFHWPYDTPADTVALVLRNAGLPGLGVNTRRGNVAAGDFGLAALPGREAEAMDAIDEGIAYAAAAGLSAVHVMAGCASGKVAEDCFVDRLSAACSKAAGHGLMILIEPLNTRDVPGYFLTGTDHARRIIERVAQPALRIMYDVYHMQIMQGDHVRQLAELGDLVGHIQIAAVPDRTEPDRGEVDMAWLLSHAACSGPVGAEYRPTSPPGGWLASFRVRMADSEASRGQV